MVHGIELFREYLGKYKSQYVFIGGIACDIILDKIGVPFRMTKDFDMVLMMEALNEDFVSDFCEFIKLGGYKHIKKGTQEHQFYRFEKPSDLDFPYMIELFSRKPDYLKTIDTRLSPIYVSDDVMSLSAILLDDNYYDLLKEGTLEIDGISVLRIECLVLFKIKAYLDLSQRRLLGEHIDLKVIKKHRNDVIRLVVHIDYETKWYVSLDVMKDIYAFMQHLVIPQQLLNQLGLHHTSPEDIFHIIQSTYVSKS